MKSKNINKDKSKQLEGTGVSKKLSLKAGKAHVHKLINAWAKK